MAYDLNKKIGDCEDEIEHLKECLQKHLISIAIIRTNLAIIEKELNAAYDAMELVMLNKSGDGASVPAVSVGAVVVAS